eukprot:229477-Chlamydomonas_euryale.AAC.11
MCLARRRLARRRNEHAQALRAPTQRCHTSGGVQQATPPSCTAAQHSGPRSSLARFAGQHMKAVPQAISIIAVIAVAGRRMKSVQQPGNHGCGATHDSSLTTRQLRLRGGA